MTAGPDQAAATLDDRSEPQAGEAPQQSAKSPEEQVRMQLTICLP